MYNSSYTVTFQAAAVRKDREEDAGDAVRSQVRPVVLLPGLLLRLSSVVAIVFVLL